MRKEAEGASGDFSLGMETEVPFLSSMVTVSLAHFMRNLAVGVSR